MTFLLVAGGRDVYRAVRTGEALVKFHLRRGGKNFRSRPSRSFGWKGTVRMPTSPEKSCRSLTSEDKRSGRTLGNSLELSCGARNLRWV